MLRERSLVADAHNTVITLPPHFARPSVQLAIDWLYHDTCPLDGSTAMPVLHVAHYLGVRGLVTLCQTALVRHVRALPEIADAVDTAARVYTSASELGLDVLSRFCATFLAAHVREARACEAYALLDAPHLDAILEALSQEHSILITTLQRLSDDCSAAT